MKTKFSLLVGLTSLLSAPLWAQQPPHDPLGENLIPPELVMRFQSDIGLSDDAKKAIQDELQNAQEQFKPLQDQLQAENEKLGALLKQNPVPEDEVMDRLDATLTLERKIKRLQFGLMVRIKNKLTPEQQAKLQELKKNFKGPSPELQAKMQKLQEGVQKLQQAGVNPQPIGQIMQEFEPLMKDGKLKEAEAVLDRALKALDESEQK